MQFCPQKPRNFHAAKFSCNKVVDLLCMLEVSCQYAIGY